MTQVEVFETIDAPPSVVWDIVLEFDSYPEWNPYIRSIDGVPVEGETLHVRIEPPSAKPRTVRATVDTVEPNRRLVLHGKLFVPLAYDGFYEIHLEPIDDDRTRLLNRETLRGALEPVLFDESAAREGFEAMNSALKARAERRAGDVA